MKKRLAEIQCFSETYEILQRYQFRKSRLHLYVQDDKKQVGFFPSSDKIKSLTCTTIVKTSRARTYNRIYSAIKARVLSCKYNRSLSTRKRDIDSCAPHTMIATRVFLTIARWRAAQGQVYAHAQRRKVVRVCVCVLVSSFARRW
uniref:Uncharacterized protein n=1 Tax=Trichogramma kaykai TaxID=54128 RepID=A0ABD2VWK9_9HYME